MEPSEKSSEKPAEEWSIVRRSKKGGRSTLLTSPVHAQLQRVMTESVKKGVSSHELITNLVSEHRDNTWNRQTLQLVREAVRGRPVDEIICRGLGSFRSRRNARHQMACAIILQREFSVPASVYDPEMTEDDNATARKLGFRLAKKAEDFKTNGEGVLLLFLPHCPIKLFELLIGIADKHSFLSRIVILGNRQRRPERLMETLASHLEKWYADHLDTDVLVEKKCPVSEESVCRWAFNDLAVGWYKRNKIS